MEVSIKVLEVHGESDYPSSKSPSGHSGATVFHIPREQSLFPASTFAVPCVDAFLEVDLEHTDENAKGSLSTKRAEMHSMHSMDCITSCRDCINNVGNLCAFREPLIILGHRRRTETEYTPLPITSRAAIIIPSNLHVA